MTPNEVAEAACSALYRLDWKHQGDTDQGRADWFLRGETPKQLRIRVVRRPPFVVLVLEWPNIATPGRVYRGVQELTVDTRVPDADLRAALEEAIVHCLLVYQDLLTGRGVASAQAVQQAPNR
jgi:hypothetical protein